MLHIGIADNIARVNTRQNATLRANVRAVTAESVVMPVAVAAIAAFVLALFI